MFQPIKNQSPEKAALVQQPVKHGYQKMTVSLGKGHDIPIPTIPQCGYFNLPRSARALAAADIVGLALLIRISGGTEKSVFSPFLIVVVAILVLLKEFDWKELLVFWTLMVGVCGVVDWIWFDPLQFMEGQPSAYRYYQVAGWLISVILPMAFLAFDKTYNRDARLGAIT